MLIKEVSRISAICELDPTAGFELTKDNVIKNWKSSVRSQPTEEEIDAKLVELKADYDNQKYQRDRAVAYDPIPEQLDQIYHDMDGWKAKIKSIKDKFPKP